MIGGFEMSKKKTTPAPKAVAFVPADPRCKKCAYYKSISGLAKNVGTKACHYMLYEGQRRDMISPTECGSFQDEKTAPKRNMHSTEVPMIQWGCGGVYDSDYAQER